MHLSMLSPRGGGGGKEPRAYVGHFTSTTNVISGLSFSRSQPDLEGVSSRHSGFLPPQNLTPSCFIPIR